MQEISYAVIALKKDHVDDVVENLTGRGLKGVAQWLDANKTDLYGPKMEDWKPFDGKSVDSFLVNDSKEVFYSSATDLMDKVKDDFSNISIVVHERIELFFLDVFALFSVWHQQLAIRLDSSFGERERKCCLVMPVGISDEGSLILTEYSKVWSSVVQGYLLGHFCPIVLRADDLTNLKSFVPILPRLGTRPYPGKGDQMDDRFGTGSKPSN